MSALARLYARYDGESVAALSPRLVPSIASKLWAAFFCMRMARLKLACTSLMNTKSGRSGSLHAVQSGWKAYGRGFRSGLTNSFRSCWQWWQMSEKCVPPLAIVTVDGILLPLNPI